MALFDFAPNSHVAEEIPPEEQDAMSMNGWEFTAKPSIPYRRKFRLVMSGMHWRMNKVQTGLDLANDPQTNAGRLMSFWLTHRKHTPFTYNHEYLGPITVRFADPVQIPKAIPNSAGLIPDFEVMLIHHNPGY